MVDCSWTFWKYVWEVTWRAQLEHDQEACSHSVQKRGHSMLSKGLTWCQKWKIKGANHGECDFIIVKKVLVRQYVCSV